MNLLHGLVFGSLTDLYDVSDGRVFSFGLEQRFRWLRDSTVTAADLTFTRPAVTGFRSIRMCVYGPGEFLTDRDLGPAKGCARS